MASASSLNTVQQLYIAYYQRPGDPSGLLFWADALGAAKILEMLKPLEPLGDRFKPTPMLVDMAASGKKFYG